MYQQKYQKWSWQREVNVASPTATTSPEGNGSTPQPQTARGKIMVDLAVKIAQISPVQPVLGGKWFVDRFWFASGSDNDLYAEYEDGHILRMILVKATANSSGFEYKVEAYFEPGESDWLLKTGQDSQSDKDLDLYEFDQNKKEWVKKN